MAIIRGVLSRPQARSIERANRLDTRQDLPTPAVGQHEAGTGLWCSLIRLAEGVPGGEYLHMWGAGSLPIFALSE